MYIPFNKANIVGKELYYIADAVFQGTLKGDGPYTHKCQQWFQDKLGINKVLLTQSCTGALELAALLLNIKEGDEVILPSFTFVSTANAFVLRGARPVFVDVREDTLNIDETKIAEKITSNTKVICPVHYAGVGCEMDSIMETANTHGLAVVEDAAHAVLAKYKNRWLGSIGTMSTLSFHETKNFNSGEGGALLMNSDEYIERAEIIWEKGTDRSKFYRGEVDKYTWVDLGGSFLPSEIITAFLYAQLELAEQINKERVDLFNRYNKRLKPLEDRGVLRRPYIPDHCEMNGHMFYILLEDNKTRDRLMKTLQDKQIGAVFHYIPLHTSKMGAKFGYSEGDLPVTESIAGRILRLPLFNGLSEEQHSIVCEEIEQFFQ